MYPNISNIRRTKSQNFNDSNLAVQLALSNPLKQGIKLNMKMQFNYIWVINNFIAYKGANYIRSLMVFIQLVNVG